MAPASVTVVTSEGSESVAGGTCGWATHAPAPSEGIVRARNVYGDALVAPL